MRVRPDVHFSPFRETDTSPHMGHDFRPCDRVIRVYVRVYRVSLVRPGSPRCIFTGMTRSMELGHAEKVLCFHKPFISELPQAFCQQIHSSGRPEA